MNNPETYSFYSFFKRASHYAFAANNLDLQEASFPQRRFPYRERHLQCLWADSRHRPKSLHTAQGEPVQVQSAGHWNLEAGPDFLNAVLLIGDPQRRIEGDLEIHIHPNAWKQHGHQNDPRYRNVRFHITWFDGPEIEQLLHIPLQPSLANHPQFSFSNIDISAYPYAIPSGEAPLKNLDPDQKRAFLEAAGEERLRNKAQQFALLLQHTDPAQLLFEEVMAAFGYKNNKEPFRQLAQNVPLIRLKERCETAQEIYAILLGCSGLLPTVSSTEWSAQTRAFIRQIWDIWWKNSETVQSGRLPAAAWNLSGCRPSNHPLRRLMAAAQLVFHWNAFYQTLQIDSKKSGNMLTELEDAYWTTHLALNRPCQPTALVGSARANTLFTNILIPWLAATGHKKPFEQGILDQLPAEPMNSLIRQTVFTLFGPDTPASIYRSALARQGLIQLFFDYVITHRLEALNQQIRAQ